VWFSKYLEFFGLYDHINSLMTIVYFDCLLASHYWRDASQVHFTSLLNQFFRVSFSQLKSSNILQKCMNWKDIAISSILFSRWYNHMWVMSIPLLFLSTPQVFPKFILILIPVKAGVSGFTNRNVQFCSLDMSDLYTEF
jgi:ABC-type phosphate/phosphonate transport system permease subunit